MKALIETRGWPILLDKMAWLADTLMRQFPSGACWSSAYRLANDAY